MSLPIENIKDNKDIFHNLDTLASGNHDIRNELIKKLYVTVQGTDFNPNELRASELEARLGMISTIDSLMKSQEAVQINQIKLNLQKDKDENESDHSGKVLELLQQIAPNMVPRVSDGEDTNAEEADELIRQRMKEEGITISEGELEKVSVIE